MSKAKKAAAASENGLTPYHEFLARKEIIDPPTGIPNPPKLCKALKPHQHALTRWALQRGRSGLFCSTGTGKTAMECEWAKIVEAHTERPVLILAPLAVGHQTVREAAKINGMDVKFIHSQDEMESRGVHVTNLQKLHKFDPSIPGGVAIDESSCLKSLDAMYRARLIEAFHATPFRLCATAVPAPNDYPETGGHAEYLGVMSNNEMLATFFVHDGGETQKWRLKGHAQEDFWKWMASWCAAMTLPSDLGFDDTGYDLPPLIERQIIVESDLLDGELFPSDAIGLNEQRKVRRHTLSQRVEECVKLVKDSREKWCIWCSLNDEQDELARALNGRCVSIQGSTEDDDKIKMEQEWREGEAEIMITKSKIFGHGLNWQHCRNVICCGVDNSFESYFQLVRRFWRFGQLLPVNIWEIASDRDGAVIENRRRKEIEAVAMQKNLVRHMANFTKRALEGNERTKTRYNPTKPMQLPSWI